MSTRHSHCRLVLPVVLLTAWRGSRSRRVSKTHALEPLTRFAGVFQRAIRAKTVNECLAAVPSRHLGIVLGVAIADVQLRLDGSLRSSFRLNIRS